MIFLPANASCPMAGSQVEQSINNEPASASVCSMGREVLDMMLRCSFNDVNLDLQWITYNPTHLRSKSFPKYPGENVGFCLEVSTTNLHGS